MNGITFFLEISRPSQIKPGWFDSAIMFRIWWLWFAFGWYKMSMDKAHIRIQSGVWISESGKH